MFEEPRLHPCPPGRQGVDVPGGDFHVASRLRTIGLPRRQLSLDARAAVTLSTTRRQPRHLALEQHGIAGNDLTAKTCGLDTTEKRQSTGIPRIGQHRDGPHWAIASRSNTPGVMGRPGKWPGKNHSSPLRVHSPLARSPGSILTMASTRRNGGRCGSQYAGSNESSLTSGPTPRFVVRCPRQPVEMSGGRHVLERRVPSRARAYPATSWVRSTPRTWHHGVSLG